MKFKDKSTKISFIVIFLVVVLIGTLLYYDYREDYVFVEEPSENGQAFSVSSGNENGPKIVNGFIDPYFAEVGSRQMISVYIEDEFGVNEADIGVIINNKETKYPLKLMSGTNTEGHWQARWKMDDTNYEDYKLAIYAHSSVEDTRVVITLLKSL